jgi:hypothetical protein
VTTGHGSAGTIRRAAYRLGATRAAIAGALSLTVTFTAACDKTNNDDAVTSIPAGQELDLKKHPTILFEVFGERDDPRMIPVASIDGGKLRPLRLSPAGWKTFDRIYNRPGVSYTLYQDGHPVGQATVKQGMWSRPESPIYTLPNCQNLIPLAAVSIDSKVNAGITVEFLATTASLSSAKGGTPLAPTAAATLARDVGARVAAGAHIPRTRLDSLDFHAVAITTGATTAPTLVVSYIDPNAEEAAAHGDETSYLFAIADKSGADYTPSFSQSVNGSAARAQYRRYVDHLDIDGNGVDEIVLEGWQYGGDSYPMIMRYKAGRWVEVYRGTASWCLDEAAK